VPLLACPREGGGLSGSGLHWALCVQLSLGVIAAMVGGWMATPVPIAAPAPSDFEL